LKAVKIIKKTPKSKVFLALFMRTICKESKLEYETEFEFAKDKERHWRFDYAVPENRIGIEYEGIMGGNSRHTSTDGYRGDCWKYNVAIALGWKVFRFTAKDFDKRNQIFTYEFLKKVISNSEDFPIPKPFKQKKKREASNGNIKP
jgi:hypothetical protein